MEGGMWLDRFIDCIIASPATTAAIGGLIGFLVLMHHRRSPLLIEGLFSDWTSRDRKDPARWAWLGRGLDFFLWALLLPAVLAHMLLDSPFAFFLTGLTAMLTVLSLGNVQPYPTAPPGIHRSNESGTAEGGTVERAPSPTSRSRAKKQSQGSREASCRRTTRGAE